MKGRVDCVKTASLLLTVSLRARSARQSPDYAAGDHHVGDKSPPRDDEEMGRRRKKTASLRAR